MSLEAHTYGPSCLLHTGSNPFTRRASELSDTPPKLRAQFFYNSALPIDDPLSPIPPPSTGSSVTISRVPPQPFSYHDNVALEEAWQKFLNPGLKVDKSKETKRNEILDRKKRDHLDKYQIVSAGSPEPNIDHFTENIKDTQRRGHATTDVKSIERPTVARARSSLSDLGPSDPDPDLLLPDSEGQASISNTRDQVQIDGTIYDEASQPYYIDRESDYKQKNYQSLFHHVGGNRNGSIERPAEAKLLKDFTQQEGKVGKTPYGSSPADHDTTGTPFLRAPSREVKLSSPIESNLPDQADGDSTTSEDEDSPTQAPKPLFPRTQSDLSDSSRAASDPMKKLKNHLPGYPFPWKWKENEKIEKVSVPVGFSRLHLVEIPELQMKPIYWSPVHDVCSVVRGTWFYKDTFFPVETDIANLLEIGYELFRPWSVTYTDEVNSCLEIGPEAELKIVHRLWPCEEPEKSPDRPGTGKSYTALMKTKSDELKADERAKKIAIETAASAANRAVGTLEGRDNKEETTKLYAKSSVIYANAKDAQILRPNQLPSVSRGRKPLGPIRKGRPIGIAVVRGFDHQAWEKLHPSKKVRTVSKNFPGVTASQPDGAITFGFDSCSACKAEEKRQPPTDLVLVIHGIGQKLSERVESFHFTHAINNFRRQMNVELEAEAVRPWIRDDFGLIVLPVNWRSNLSLEDVGAPLNPSSKDKASTKPDFTLKDITADTIPAVRNLISDVMLDIPYYLSHHKPKMVEAVTLEANRVYHLWCENNPNFVQRGGRVHIIAHSLGSVMAIDILSKQPTFVPKQRELKGNKAQGSIFDFDTSNLFFCGSPAGFFLLLNRANLLPRRGRNKPGTDKDHASTYTAGEAGTFGCLAVDNIYNIIHYNDPIAYRVNACVDVSYAASLQPAVVPSASSSWLQSIGSVFRSKSIVPNGPASLDAFPARPTIAKLPSTMEMETHNFTQEELAERKMYLLNDNGQIDYFLSSGGGPLEIQYLNMLSAHSSYWVLQDFVRFLVVEIGRKPGRDETLLAMRATKKIRGIS